MVDLEKQYQDLEDLVRSYAPTEDFSMLRKGFEYANSFHTGQLRKDGTPYITHPLAVAKIVAELGLDMDSIMSALLHDVIEDTSGTYEDIEREFSGTVADLVEAITKLSKMHYTSKEEEQMENLRKMFMAMAKDIRVILIKICDRLHNMRTMEYQTPIKQREKSLETMEIYAPIAHRLGMQKLKWELEDLSLRYLDPIGYGEIEQDMGQRRCLHTEFLDAAQKRITDRISEENIFCSIYGRVKHTYSIYRKMFLQNRTLDEIFDLYAIRVIVDDVAQCYNVLGCVHDLYKPIQGRFKDYIGTPKPNLYQSLHTTVIGRAGIPFEVQIRTWEMHQIAEYGVAAHWKYKQGMADKELGTEHDFEWVRKLLESQKEMEAEEFLHTMKVDMFSDEVFVFTPNGDVKSLPSKATPIDFAYSIHSQVGNSMTGAKVNGRMVPFEYQLQNGEVVEILTTANSKGPSRDWLQSARSPDTRSKIRQWFKKERRGENIASGRASIEAELKYQGLNFSDITRTEVLTTVLKKLDYLTLEDVYAAVGYGGLTAHKVVNRMGDELKKLGSLEEKAKENANSETSDSATAEPSRKERKQQAVNEKNELTGIIVDDIDDCLVKFARCCCPVPGDQVTGYITRGYGVSVHRKDCLNVKKDPDDKDEMARWVKVSWAENIDMPLSYKTSVEISAKDRDGLMLDVATVLRHLKTKTCSVSMRGMSDGYAVSSLDLEVKNNEELETVINKLSQLKSVYHVARSTGK